MLNSNIFGKSEDSPGKSSSISINYDQGISEFYHEVIKNKDDDFEEYVSNIRPFLQRKILNNLELANIGQYIKTDVSLNSACGRSVGEKELYYRCIDCDKIGGKEWDHSVYALQCKECFEKSNHKGHKIIQKISTGKAVCDCGDIGAWNKEGFCSDHSGFSEQKAQAIIGSVPNDIADRFKTILLEVFYNLFFMVEASDKKSLDQQLRYVVAISLRASIKTINDFAQVHEAFKLLLGQIFEMKLDSKNNKLRHDCSNSNERVYLQHKKPCECTILENIFRFINFGDEEYENHVRNLLIDLFPDYTFKKYLTNVYIKMINMLFLFKSDKNDNNQLTIVESELTNLSTQLLITNELAFIITDSKHFTNIEYGLMKMLDKFKQEDWYKISEQFYQLSANIIYLCEQIIPCQRIILQNNIIQSIVNLILKIDSYIGPYLDNLDDIKNWMMKSQQSVQTMYTFQARMLEMLEDCLKAILRFDKEERNTQIKKICEIYLYSYRKFDSKTKDITKPKLIINSCYTRSFALILCYSLDDIPTKSNIQLFFNENFKFNDNEEKYDFINFILNRTINTCCFIYTSKYMGFDPFSIVMLSHVIDNSYLYYTYPSYKCFDCDIFLMQTMSLIIDTLNIYNEFWLHLDTPYYNKDKNKLAKALDLLVFVTEDEISIMNLMITRIRLKINDNENTVIPNNDDNLLMNQYRNMNNKCIEITKKVLINVLHIYNIATFKEIKDELSVILHPKIRLDNIIDEIGEFDNKTRKFKLKEIYKKNYNPYIFDRFDHISLKLKNKLREINEKNANFDIVISDNNSPVIQLVQDIKMSVFNQEKLLNAIINTYLTNETYQNNLLFFLRIIYYGYELYCNYLHKEHNPYQYIKNLLTDDLKQFIIKIKSDAKLSDYQPVIDKILKIESKIMNTISNIVDEQIQLKDETESNKPGSEILDKKMQKKREIMQKFALKQQEFLKSASMTFDTSPEIETKIRPQQSDCPYCREDLKSNLYGYPVMISLSNLYLYGILPKLNDKPYDIYGLNKMDAKQSLQFEKGYPVFNGCGHAFHYNCYQTLIKSQAFSEFHHNNYYEYECRICKKLNNFLLPNFYDQEIQPENLIKFDFKIPEQEDAYKKIKEKLALPLKKNAKIIDEKFASEDYLNEIKTLIVFEYVSLKLPILDLDATCLQDSVAYSIFRTVPENYIYNIKKVNTFTGSLFQYFKNLILYNPDNQSSTKIIDNMQKTVENVLNYLDPKNSQTDNAFENFELSLINSLLALRILSYDDESFFNDSLNFLSLVYLFLAISTSYLSYITENGTIFDTNEEEVFENLLKLFINETMVDEKLLSALNKNVKTAIAKITLLYNIIGLNYKTINDYNELKTKDLRELINMLFISRIPGIQENVMVFPEFLKTNSTYLKGIINKMLKEPKIKYFYVSDTNYAMSQFPESLYDFKGRYIHEKCDKCNNFPHTGLLTVCIICGYKLCKYLCQGNDLQKVDKDNLGNLNCHALKYHMGVCIFVDISNTALILINSPKNIFTVKTLYTDKFGQELEGDKTNWQDYKLNKLNYDHFKQCLDQDKIPEELVEQIHIQNKKLKDGII